MKMKKKIQISAENKTKCRENTIEVYDKVRKVFITPTVIDMDYVPI